MNQYKITKEDIFQATNGGLDIIRHYISDIDNYIGKSNKKFSLREEKTPSCSIKQLGDGNYVIADFGDGGRWMNGIALTQKNENCEYGEAIKIIAERHNVGSLEGIKSMYEPLVSSSEAKPDQIDGEWSFNHAEEASENHLRILFSERAWTYIESQYNNRPPEERKSAVLKHFRSILKEQHWHSLNSYVIIKKRKEITFSSTEFYPIFRIEEEGKDGKRFSKIYQPKAKEKGRRFFYHGAFDAQFLHGYQQVKRAYEALLKQDDDDVNEESDGKKDVKKLDEIIYCTGGSDALNLRALGYQVVYPSSEHFKLTKDQLFNLNLKAHNIMTCPDLDFTGQLQNHRLCMNTNSDQYLDIRTIDLPAVLTLKKDQYGRECKDLRDYLKHFSATDLRNQIKVAMMYRFWDYQIAFDRSGKVKIRYGRPLYEYKLSIERVLNFLIKNGFGRRKVSEETIEYIQIDGNLVRQVRPEDIKTYLLNFLRSRFVSEDLLNVVHRSTNLTVNSFDSLPILEPDFKDYEIDAQYLFFKNTSWKVTGKGIEPIDLTRVDKMVWERRIIPHEVKLLPPMFEATVNEFGSYSLKIHNQSCLFFRFLIQISRTHWRTELETNLDGLSPAEIDAYKVKHKFDIAGPNLTDNERHDQIQHLLNKIYLFGYMVHRYKDDSKPWVPYVMDDTPNTDGLSHGRSGKSIFIKGVKAIRNLLVLDGKNSKLLDDPHALEQINVNTDMVLIDDVIEEFPMERTFTMTTNDWTVNPKGKTRISIPFEIAPKLAITTNFAPKNPDQSTMGRVFFAGASNYYHIEIGDGKFRETRQPADEFGKLLFREQYTKEEWNDSLNFMAQCCQFYLSWKGEPIKAPMKNIQSRTLSNTIGLNFLSWAEVFFSEDGGRLNCFIPTHYAIEEYKNETGIKTITPHGFNLKLRTFAQLKSMTLNPKDTKGTEGRVIKNWFELIYDNREKKWKKSAHRKTQSMIYFQTSTSLNDRVYDPTIEEIDLPKDTAGADVSDWLK